MCKSFRIVLLLISGLWLIPTCSMGADLPPGALVLGGGGVLTRLFTVPAGTDVRWITRNAPHEIHHLTAPAKPAEAPVYGWRKGLLAVWYRPQADQLAVYLPAKIEPLLTLTRRPAELSVRTLDGDYPYDLPMRLFPLLPVPAPNSIETSRWDDLPIPAPLPGAGTETQAVQLPPKTVVKADLWATEYMAACDGFFGVYTRLDVPLNGNKALKVPVDEFFDHRWPMPMSSSGIKASFPTGKLAVQRKAGAGAIGFTYDTPYLITRQTGMLAADGRLDLPAPRKPATVSVEWPGVGVVHDLPVPPLTQGQQAPLALPDWEPGAGITGTLQDSDGHPVPNAKLVVKTRLCNDYENLYTVTTDANGRFTITGLLSGPVQLFLLDPPHGEPCGWSVTAPVEGTVTTVLTVVKPEQTRRLMLEGPGNYTQAWWLPAKGRPQALPCWGIGIACHTPPTGTGRLYYIIGTHGWARLCPLTTGLPAAPLAKPAPGPSLGLYFPLDKSTGIPGAVTLLGQGDLDGLRLDFPQLTWLPSTLLNQLVAQIDTVPPGTYNVIANTPKGRVESTVTVGADGGAVELKFP